MDCYLCAQEPRPGGTRYGIQTAVGICQTCGVAVCLPHSRKAAAPGAPLHCRECAQAPGAEQPDAARRMGTNAGAAICSPDRAP